MAENKNWSYYKMVAPSKEAALNGGLEHALVTCFFGTGLINDIGTSFIDQYIKDPILNVLKKQLQEFDEDQIELDCTIVGSASGPNTEAELIYFDERLFKHYMLRFVRKA
jgi:hypothetical protein